MGLRVPAGCAAQCAPGPLPFFLCAGCGKKLPGQQFAVNEEVVVEDVGRRRQQVGLFVFFLLGAGLPLLGQKIGIRKPDRRCLSRAQFLPFVTPDFPVRDSCISEVCAASSGAFTVWNSDSMTLPPLV